MKAVYSRTQERERDNVIADIATTIAALFARCHMLSGFSVQDRATQTRDRNMALLDGDLCVADVSVHPGFCAPPVLYDEIAQALLDLLDEHPEAYEILRGQTFARTFH